MRPDAEYGVGIDPAKSGKPVDIRTAFELWCAVAALGVLASITLVFVVLGDRDTFTAEVTRQIEQMGTEATGGIDVALAVNVGVAVACLMGVALAAAVYAIARQLRAGKHWARLVLTGGAAFVTVSAISSFAAERQSGAASLTLDAIMILQAVLAMGATVLSHRRDASLYLAKRPPR